MADSDWNTIASMYAEDCVSVDPDGAVFEGREANLANDQKWASMMSDFKFNYANTVESGNATVVEMEITGTMTGEMPMPDGTSIPPTGKTNKRPLLGILLGSRELLLFIFCRLP